MQNFRRKQNQRLKKLIVDMGLTPVLCAIPTMAQIANIRGVRCGAKEAHVHPSSKLR